MYDIIELKIIKGELYGNSVKVLNDLNPVAINTYL